MGHNINQINFHLIVKCWDKVIVFLCLTWTLAHNVVGEKENSVEFSNTGRVSFNNALTTTKVKDVDANFETDKTEKLLHNSGLSFPFKIDDVSKAHKTLSNHVVGKQEKQDELFDERSDSSSGSSMESDFSHETEREVKIYNNLEKLFEQLENSKTGLVDVEVIKQAFQFVKLDSQLNSLASQLSKLQDIHELMHGQIVKQERKFDLLLDHIRPLVNFVAEESKVNAMKDKIKTEIEEISQKLDQVVEKIIQSSTTSHVMFELSKDSLKHMEKMEIASREVLNEVKAVKTELGDVGQASIQTIYNLNKLEENLMMGLEQVGNQTVYALRQDAKLIRSPVLLEDGYEGSSIQYQADEGNPNPGGSHSSVKKLSLVGGTIKAESLVACLSRKRLINENLPKDCTEIQRLGHKNSGIYAIFPSINSNLPTKVYCDLETNGGGWTLIQRRTDQENPVENFYRTWREYEIGFGSPQKQYWLGLNNIAAITEFGDHELRIEMTDWSGDSRDANFAYFRVSNASDKFRLHVSDYSGSAGDSLSYHNGMAFSTKDQDNDVDNTVNCAQRYQGAWWYKNCHQSNLNGVYIMGSHGKHKSYGIGINYYSWHGYYYSIRKVEMKIRSRFFSSTLSLSSPK